MERNRREDEALKELLGAVYTKKITTSDLADARTEVTTLRLRVEVLESYINDARRAGYEAAREQAAKVADRNDQSAWGIALEIRAMVPATANKEGDRG